MLPRYKVAVIGGGVLGTSIAYFLSGHAKDPSSIVLIEQEQNIGRHTSSRNTGKVHAPFLYDPVAKKTFAKAATLGYEMWMKFAASKKLGFKRDGVLEVALDDKGEPTSVPPIVPQTPDEKRRWDRAAKRRADRVTAHRFESGKGE